MISQITRFLLSAVALAVAVAVVLGAKNYSTLIPTEYHFWEQWATQSPIEQQVATEPEAVEPQVIEPDTLPQSNIDTLQTQHIE